MAEKVKSTFNGSTNDARVHAQKVARARVAEKKAAEGSVDHVVLTPELLVRASTAGPPA